MQLDLKNCLSFNCWKAYAATPLWQQGQSASQRRLWMSECKWFGNLSFFLCPTIATLMSSNWWGHCVSLPTVSCLQGFHTGAIHFPEDYFQCVLPHLYFGSIILRLVPISLINNPLSKFTVLLWVLAGIFMHQMKDFDFFFFFFSGTQEKLTIYVTSGMEEYPGKPLKIQSLLDQGTKALCSRVVCQHPFQCVI